MSRVQVSDAVHIQNGFAFESELFSDKRAALPVARIRDVMRGYSNTYYTGSYRKEYEIGNGDLLIGMDGEFNVGIWQGGRALLNQRVCKIIPKDGIADKNYLKYRLALLVKEMEAATPYVTVKHLSSEELKAEEIELPSLVEQKRIAAFLEKADRLRRTRGYARQLSDTFLQSVFLEMFGDSATNPGNFDKATFDDVVDSTQLGLVRGSGEMNDSFPFAYVRMDSIIGNGTLELSEVKHVKASAAEAIQFALKDGDFLFNTRNSRELVGKTALFVGGGTYLFNNNILRVRFKTSADPRYMIQLFQTNWMKQYLERVKSGTTNVFAIYYKDLRDVPVLLPPLPLQQKFADIVRRFERLSAQQRETERQAEHLFQTLLHRAFTEGV